MCGSRHPPKLGSVPQRPRPFPLGKSGGQGQPHWLGTFLAAEQIAFYFLFLFFALGRDLREREPRILKLSSELFTSAVALVNLSLSPRYMVLICPKSCFCISVTRRGCGSL